MLYNQSLSTPQCCTLSSSILNALHFHEEMNGLHGIARWKNLKQRLSFKGLGCCGPTWSARTTIRNIIEEEEEEEEEEENEEQPIMFLQDQLTRQTPLAATAAAQTPVRNSGRMMNLGMALAAERDMRRSNVGPSKNVGPVKTLMRLIEETDGVDLRKKKKRRESQSHSHSQEYGNDWVCCVCMERNKGAALIPCGHTYCRICSRDMWANRGCCPICNRSILEILDIF